MKEFKPFPKLARLNRQVIVTEKLDGTNACVVVDEDGRVSAQSRNRIITPEDDNFGFAAWVTVHSTALAKLGPGYHYGEWWGRGIQRGYDLKDRRFSLFNVTRWSDPTVRPACCRVVPVLSQGIGFDVCIEAALYQLRTLGSMAAPGFMQPEGIVAFHEASGQSFKVTLENDEKPKGAVS